MFRIRMGNEGSLPMDCVAFDADEIKRLGKRYKGQKVQRSKGTKVKRYKINKITALT